MMELARRRTALKEAISGDEENLKGALSQLKTSLRDEVSVGQRVARSPYRLLAYALGAGFLLGVLRKDEQPDTSAATSTIKTLWKFL